MSTRLKYFKIQPDLEGIPKVVVTGSIWGGRPDPESLHFPSDLFQ